MKRLQEIEGYVTIGLQGNELSRFLRLCSNHNIFVWNIIFVEWNMIQINLKARELFRTKEYLEKTKTHICYIQRRGLFFKLKRYRAKRVYLICGVVSLFMLFLLSNYIWSIQVVGNSYISDETVREYLKKQGCGIGNYKNTVDTEMLEKQMLQDFPEIIWNSVSIHGTTVHISVKEQIQNDEVQDKKQEPKDLVAPIDGKVASVYIRNGTKAVSLNQSVKKGDVLVYGWVPIYNDSGTEIIKYNPGVADADVMIQGKIKWKHAMDNQYNRRIYSGRAREYYYVSSNFGKYDFVPYMFGKLNSTKRIETSKMVFMDTFPLPFYMNHIVEQEYYFCKETYRRDAIQRRQYQFCDGYIKKLQEKGIQIIDKNVMITYGNKQSILYGEILCRWPATKYSVSVVPDIENVGIESE